MTGDLHSCMAEWNGVMGSLHNSSIVIYVCKRFDPVVVGWEYEGFYFFGSKEWDRVSWEDHDRVADDLEQVEKNIIDTGRQI